MLPVMLSSILQNSKWPMTLKGRLCIRTSFDSSGPQSESSLPRQSNLGLNFGFLFFSAFSRRSLSGLYSACVTNACVRHMEFTEVVVVQSY